jgi:hypothetical protein
MSSFADPLDDHQLSSVNYLSSRRSTEQFGTPLLWPGWSLEFRKA